MMEKSLGTAVETARLKLFINNLLTGRSRMSEDSGTSSMTAFEMVE
jgi:hypothetical protein